MNICIATYDTRITPDMHATKGVGAGEHCVGSLANALKKLGHDVTISGAGWEGTNNDIQWIQERNGCYDLVICHRNVSILEEPYITTTKILWGIDAGGLPPENLMVDYIIPISENLRHVVWRNYESKVIPLGIDITDLSPLDEKSPYNLLFCGAVIECRGIMQAAAIWRKLYAHDDRYRLHIIGSAQTWGDDIQIVGKLGIASQQHVDDYLCQYLMENDKLHPNVHIYGRIPTSEVLKILPAMGYQLALRSYETCGVAIIEGQSRGVIPVVGNVMCLPERVVDGNGNEAFGKVVSDIGEAGIDEAVEYILSKQDFAKISNRCIEEAQKYDWLIIANKIIQSVEEYSRETIGIGITNYNKLEAIQRAVKSIQENVIIPYKLIVFDNSPADSPDRLWLNMQQNIEVLSPPPDWKKAKDAVLDNPGNAYAKNRMIEKFIAYGFQYALLMDNDVELLPSCAETMYRTMKYNPKIGIVGCLQANIITGKGGYVDEIASICSMVRLQMFTEAGKYPEQLVYYSLDSWQNTLATMYGWKTYVLPYDLYIHKKHTSLSDMSLQQAHIDRDKWGEMKRTWAAYWTRVLTDGFSP